MVVSLSRRERISPETNCPARTTLATMLARSPPPSPPSTPPPLPPIPPPTSILSPFQFPSAIAHNSSVTVVDEGGVGGHPIPCRAAVAAVDMLIFHPPPNPNGSLAVHYPSSSQLVARLFLPPMRRRSTRQMSLGRRTTLASPCRPFSQT